ncbi:MAG: HU family DNA-binding protein [Paludibacter sp.]|nr:HU family DNA-binding protein [Paludibacter sp.]
MIKDKISSQEIIDLVASKASVSKRAAEEFLKMMISSIEDALYAGEQVKIKNFGTFKLQWNEPRKSVNIQTGEDILLAGYHKVTFTPDTILKDLVNEPFAHLEPVELDGENAIDLQKEETSDIALDPLRVFTEQASEIKNLLSEIQALSTPEPDLIEVESREDTKVENSKKEYQQNIRVEIPDYVFVNDEPEILENETPELKISDTEEPIIFLEQTEKENAEHKVVVDEKSTKSEVVVLQSTDNLEEADSTMFIESIKPVRNRKTGIILLVIFVFLIGGYVSLYLFNSGVKACSDKAFMGVITELVYVKDRVCNWMCPKPQKALRTEVLIIPKDTLANDSVTENDVDSLQLLFDNPRVYTEFIATEQLRKSSRLTLISLKYYGTKDFWVYIYEANKERISNPDDISSGTLIRIPKLDSRLIDASNPRCMKKAKELHDQYVKG